jgi:hypothetical protein
MPSAAQARAMAAALHGLDTERWTQPDNLVTAAAATPDDGATTRVPPASRYPRALRSQELTTGAFEDIKNTQGKLTDFTDILSAPDRVDAPFANAMYRSMSTSWRGNAGGAQAYRDAVADYLDSLTKEVRLVSKSDLTLSGRSATIPVTVQNQLVQDVDNLVLRLTSHKPTRLRIDGHDAVAEQPIHIGGGHSQSVKFTGTGNANGPVEVTAQLYTADGKPYGRPMDFQIKISEITPTVMLVIAGGVLLLVLAGVRMYSQRKRAAARRAAAEQREKPDDPASAQPSDQAADTGLENVDPSGAGEKVDR